MISDYERTRSDLVENIQIDENFQILHPDYLPNKLSSQAAARIEQLSPELRAKYLKLRLRDYLHDLYFSHSAIDTATIAARDLDAGSLKNNSIDGVDIDLLRQLEQSNSSRGYFDPGWQIVGTQPNDELLVVKAGLHLHIDPQFHLHPDDRQAVIGDVVPIWLPPHGIDLDAYIIVGEAGTPMTTAIDLPPTVRLYFNFTPEAAIAIATSLTPALNQSNIPFQFAILHDPQLFHRYDSGVLWLRQVDYLAVQETIADLYRSHQSAFTAAIPLCAKQLAPGVGIVEEPPDGDFGLHRCESIAAGLIDALATSATDSQAKLAAIRDRFSAAGISWQHPHLNLDRDDPYTAFVF